MNCMRTEILLARINGFILVVGFSYSMAKEECCLHLSSPAALTYSPIGTPIRWCVTFLSYNKATNHPHNSSHG